jgi:hypothetical protein
VGRRRALTKEDQVVLGDYLENQCWYELVSFPAHGGVALVDKRLGTAQFWLVLDKRGSRQGMVVRGSLSGLPEDGQRVQGILRCSSARCDDATPSSTDRPSSGPRIGRAVFGQNDDLLVQGAIGVRNVEVDLRHWTEWSIACDDR